MRLSVVALILLLALSPSGWTETIHVPSGAPTIQAGIDAASPGDTVLVAPGTFTGDGNRDIDFDGKAITVKSETGPEATVIECEGTEQNPHRGFYFHHGEGSDSRLEGFTVRYGFHEDGGGIYFDSSNPTLTNCTIIYNAALSDSLSCGGGIYVDDCSPVMIGCSITDNWASKDGGGIYCMYSRATLTDCTISKNRVSGNFICQGGGVFCLLSDPTLTNCTISDNWTTHHGGGICCFSYSDPTLRNCVISGNQLEFPGCGGGLSCWNNSHPALINCIVADNTTPYEGGALWCESSDPNLTNCTLTGNRAGRNGDGICSWSFSEAVVTNSILWDNSPEEIHVFNSSVTVSFSDIEGGYAGDGNIDENPRFVPFPVHGFEYVLRPGSPCIDSGDPSIEDGLYDWHPAWPDWYPDGARSDMGAYGGRRNWKWLR